MPVTANEFDQFFTTPGAPSSGGEFDQFFTPQARSSSAGPTRWDAFRYSAADAASFGFGDEGAGVIAGVGAVLGGQDYALAYRQRVDAARQRLDEARARHPVSSLAGTVVGAGATFLVPGGVAATGARFGLGGVAAAGRAGQALTTGRFLPYGSTLLRHAAGRGPGALLAQSVLGAGTGASFGAVYGAGAANEGDRVAGAQQGAMWGGGLGLAGPAAFQMLGNAGRVIYQNPTLRTMTGAGIGGAIGYTQGDTDEERQQNALRGAAFGGAASLAARPVLNAARSAWSNPRAAFGNQTGMSIGIPPVSGGGGAQPEVQRGVVRAVDRLLGRQRADVDALEGNIAAAQSEPMGRTLADVGGEQFLAKVDMLAQSPGQTGPRAAAIAEARAGAMGQQIDDGLRSGLGVTRSPTQARQAIVDARRNNSDGYEEVLAQDLNQEALTRRLIPLMRLRRFQPVLQRRYEIEQDLAEMAQLRGQAPPPRSVVFTESGGYELSPNATGRALHDLKTNVDDVFAAATDPRRLDAAGKGERFAVLDPLRRDFLDALDETIPGYAARRATAGGLFEADEALTTGKGLLSLRPEEIAERMRFNPDHNRATTAFEQEHYRIAAADDLLAKIWKSATDEGSARMRNAANPIVSPEMKNRIRALFGDATKADAFVRRVNDLDRLFRNSSRWVGGADTFRRAAQAGDSLMAAMGDAGATAATGNPVGAASQLGRTGINALRGRFLERENDELGNALLRIVDEGTPEDRAYMAALMRELRRLEQGRAARATAAAREGGLGGVGGGQVQDAYAPY